MTTPSVLSADNLPQRAITKPFGGNRRVLSSWDSNCCPTSSTAIRRKIPVPGCNLLGSLQATHNRQATKVTQIHRKIKRNEQDNYTSSRKQKGQRNFKHKQDERYADAKSKVCFFSPTPKNQKNEDCDLSHNFLHLFLLVRYFSQMPQIEANGRKKNENATYQNYDTKTAN